MFSYESLDIWQLAIAYAKEVYKITKNFPRTEQYGRSSVSISANITEGSGASGTKDKLNYLDIAIKSALESTSEIQIAFELGFVKKDARGKLYGDAELLIKKIRSFKRFVLNNKLLTTNH